MVHSELDVYSCSTRSRISQTGVPTPEFSAKTYYMARIFSENYMKMKEIGLVGLHVPNAPPGPLMSRIFNWEWQGNIG